MWAKLGHCGLLIVIILNSSGAAASSSDVEKFKHSWTAQALALQRQIDINTPLNRATFLGTHNSENSVSYQIPFVRYVDPNQNLSIYDQLEMGVRSLEFDVQWSTDAHFSKDILLCHALSNHVGCSVFDRPAPEGLQELHDWLKANPNEIVLLFFDRALDGHEPRLTSYVEEYLGEFIYKPTQVRKSLETTPTCVALPGTLTKADILKAGKQLLIVAKNCDGTNPPYAEQDKFKLNWNDYVFAGIGAIPQTPFTFLDSTIGDDFTPYPDCGKSTLFVSDPEHTSLWRIFEDRTILSNIEHPHKKLLADDMKNLVRCGINWQTMDMLTADDDRLTAAVWSWAPSYPDNNGNCAIYQLDSGIKNMPCAQTVVGFTCKEATTQAFKVVTTSGQWQDGETLCQVNAGKNWHFAMPINGNEMYLFQQVLQETGLSQVWLNYHVDKTGDWHAND